MEPKDYGLLAFVFGWTGLLLLVFQQSQLPGEYPIWLMFSTAFLFCMFLATGFLFAGIVKKLMKPGPSASTSRA